MFVFKVEMSAERKNVSFKGTESRVPPRMTKNSKTQAPGNRHVSNLTETFG